MTPDAWQSEFLLKPVQPSDQIIKEEWIRTYENLPSEKPAYSVLSTDLAFTEGRGDYTVLIGAHVYGTGESLRVYVTTPIFRKQVNPLDAKRAMKDMALAVGGSGWRRAKILVEDMAAHRLLVGELISENYPTEEVKLRGQSKRTRLMSVSHLFQGGKVFFPASGAESLRAELVGFGVEKHDDLADAMSLLLIHVLENDVKPKAIFGKVWGDDSDLAHLNSRERMIEMEKRSAMRAFFQI